MKKILSLIAILAIAALFWYFFLKPQDYQVNFKVNTFPGTVNQMVKFWESELDTVEKVVQNGEITSLTQTLRFGDSIHTYNWRVKALTDSTSKISVHIKDQDHSLMNRLTIPFSDTDFEKRSRKTLLDFNEVLTQHLDRFKVTIIGESEIPTTYAACVPLKTSQHGKAGGMMNNLSLLSQLMLTNQVSPNGPPMIEVTDWDMEKDSISYNFCFPIIRSEQLPTPAGIIYKRIHAKKALKAIYNGNYITSDRAWYALLDYAERNDIAVVPKPIEVFHNNPNTGGDELRWKAEIYLPIKDYEK